MKMEKEWQERINFKLKNRILRKCLPKIWIERVG